MARLREWFSRMSETLRKRRTDSDLEEELRLHLELAAQEAGGADSSPERAARAARLRAGSIPHTMEALRDQRDLTGWLRAFVQDVRFALRQFRRTPSFAIFAVLSLALATGANATIFSAVDALLLRSLPYADADRLVRLYEAHPRRGARFAVSAGNFLSWRERNTIFDDMAIFRAGQFDLLGGDVPARLDGAAVSTGLLRVLGVPPVLGRDFRSADGLPGSAPVVIISSELWQTRFGGSADTIGRSVRLGDTVHTVVGVLPPDFRFPAPEEITARRIDVLSAVRFAPDAHTDRRNKSNRVIARLKPGVTVEQARAEMDTLAANLEREFGDSNREWRVTVLPLRSAMLGPMTRALPVSLAAVAVVLLIACANIAGLLVARGVSRTREYATRLALGCGRGRLVRQIVTETAVLWLAAGGLGIGLAFFGRHALVAIAPQDLPGLEAAAIDARAVAYTLVVCSVTALVFALLPAMQAIRADLLPGGFASHTGAHHTPRAAGQRALVVFEVGLAGVVVYVAALLLTSFARLNHVDPGFEPQGVVTVSVMPAPHRYREPHAIAGLYSRLLERFAAVPGVRDVAVASFPPFVWGDLVFGYRVNGQTRAEPANWYSVNATYFRVMGIPVLAGRTFTDTDGAQGTSPVAIISERLAQLRFAGVNPIGRTIRVGPAREPRVIVGVVGNTKHYGLDTATREQIYEPFTQVPIDAMTFLLKSDLPPAGVTAAVRRAVFEEDPEQTTSHPLVMEEVVARSTARARFLTLLVSLFGVLALSLAACGVYALIAYRVTNRQREIGVRLALGASAGSVVRLFMAEGLTLVLVGLSVGLTLAVAGSKPMEVLLFETSIREPAVLLVAPVVLAIAGLAASVIPAARAARIDPVGTLRAE
jgi:putative ABC transport system permease protein